MLKCYINTKIICYYNLKIIMLKYYLNMHAK